MGVTAFSDEQTSSISATRFFKASVIDFHNLIPKLLPQIFKSVEILQGVGAAGPIMQIKYAEGTNLKSSKFLIDELNQETLTYNYSLIEGNPLTKKLHKISYEVKMEQLTNGGSIAKVIAKYFSDDNFTLEEEDVKAQKERFFGLFKAVEAYLVQNPDAYA